MSTFLGEKRPLVVAHRGASAVAPELTMAAYLQATKDGADGYECDVRLTKDLIPVLIHDNNLNRVSNGFGRVGAKTYAELSQLDFGSWFGKPTNYSTEQWCSLLTLDDFLSYAASQTSAPIVLIETKHLSQNGIKLESAVISIINKYSLDTLDPTEPRAALMSFSIPALKRAKRIDSNLYTVFLIDRIPPRLVSLSNFVGSNAWGIGVHLLRTNPELVELARSNGKQVFVWTVDTPEQIKICLKYKVDVIITNHPVQTKNFIASNIY